MSALIRNRSVVVDTWTVARALEDVPDSGDVVVPLALWRLAHDRLGRHERRVGVLLAPDDDPADLAPDLDRIELVAIDFPHFADGRGYSTARLLRERFRYTGELRALGDVGRDQIHNLSRLGFDAFALRRGERPDDAIAALDDFSEAYQASVDRPQPLFRRRQPATTIAADAAHEGAPR